MQTDHAVRISNEFHLAARLAPAIPTVRRRPAREERQLATAVPTNAGGSAHNTVPLRSNDSRVPSLPNRTTAVRTTRAYRRTTLCNSRAHNFAQLPEHRSEMSTQLQQERRHHGCTQCIAIAGRERHNCSVVLRRLRISTGYSQPITAALSAGCKGSIYANSTPIPPQTHDNR